MPNLSKEQKVRRLEYQIAELRETAKKCKGTKRYSEAIQRREEAIKFLKKTSASWEDIQKLLEFRYYNGG